MGGNLASQWRHGVVFDSLDFETEGSVIQSQVSAIALFPYMGCHHF